MTILRRIQVSSLAVIVLSAVSPQRSGAAMLQGCDFCANSCPGALREWCQQQGCAGSGGVCEVAECQGTDNQWYDYSISCAES